MVGREAAREVVRSQRESLSGDLGVAREASRLVDFSLPFAFILTGVRRCGKSTLLLQLMREAVRDYCYFNFEDPRVFGMGLNDLELLDAALMDEYGSPQRYFFDEIQNVGRWELFVRSRLDAKKRFVLTGSNASLMSKELGTKLTGRHLSYEVFPFSFTEFLSFSKGKPGPGKLGEYLAKGGFPEYLKSGREDVLQNLLNDIIARDVVVRHGMRETGILREMAVFLLTNAGKEFSFNGLKKSFGLGSANTASAFVSFFEDAYMLMTVPRFSFSFKVRLASPKKAYAVDTGFQQANSLSFSKDEGRLLENAVFLQLRRRGAKEVYYFREEAGECDFVVRERGVPPKAIQACLKLDKGNEEREVAGLAAALDALKLGEGTIITLDQEYELREAGKKISVVPAWKWMSRKP